MKGCGMNLVCLMFVFVLVLMSCATTTAPRRRSRHQTQGQGDVTQGVVFRGGRWRSFSLYEVVPHSDYLVRRYDPDSSLSITVDISLSGWNFSDYPHLVFGAGYGERVDCQWSRPVSERIVCRVLLQSNEVYTIQIVPPSQSGVYLPIPDVLRVELRIPGGPVIPHQRSMRSPQHALLFEVPAEYPGSFFWSFSRDSAVRSLRCFAFLYQFGAEIPMTCFSPAGEQVPVPARAP